MRKRKKQGLGSFIIDLVNSKSDMSSLISYFDQRSNNKKSVIIKACQTYDGKWLAKMISEYFDKRIDFKFTESELDLINTLVKKNIDRLELSEEEIKLHESIFKKTRIVKINNAARAFIAATAAINSISSAMANMHVHNHYFNSPPLATGGVVIGCDFGFESDHEILYNLPYNFTKSYNFFKDYFSPKF